MMMMRSRWRWLIGPVSALLLLAGGFLLLRAWVNDKLTPEPETIAATSLQGLREQNRLSAFAARYVAVVTSQQTRFGLSARKTLIMPGTVRYEVDLSKLKDDDLNWNAGTNTLTVRLPQVEISGPEVDIAAIREYDGGGILMAVTDAEKALDDANRKHGREELLKQAAQPVALKLARDATRRAVETNFSTPLRAAGLNATVIVLFAGEDNDDQMDRSRSLNEVYGADTTK